MLFFGFFAILVASMFINLWNDFLYQPVFNFLIWIYNNWTDQNLGWAVVYLTIVLRMVLLPFTLVTEKTKTKNDEIDAQVKQIEKDHRDDPVKKKEELRRLFKKRKTSPWSTVVVLGVQILVLVLLYQVFLRGITGEKILRILYPFMDFPGQINVMFYGFNLGETRTIIWPGITALYLLLEIYLDYRKQKFNLTKSDLAYFILFPAFSFLALWFLPMVKSLFILTTMTFSVIISQFSKVLFKEKKTVAKHH
ncbi:MAG: Membrane protein insertase YidC [Candidatus Magasanikbacteria bacterium GW2011_GWC2_37_14]|uniref:Membrane protein insertase YidC n=1 Tax=Candidatus Magasanikbacteria bacterium GW2011_GWC2_37_14 TaxID=1619046 RepID=A0A0G0GE28_9BACT|nr:MAG: Membrane protein insertase YidC [Candidatus Magasanikbacteria bacterium GW2011_GWC2_37_14]